jgi:hypothetical protein
MTVVSVHKERKYTIAYIGARYYTQSVGSIVDSATLVVDKKKLAPNPSLFCASGDAETSQ